MGQIQRPLPLLLVVCFLKVVLLVFETSCAVNNLFSLANQGFSLPTGLADDCYEEPEFQCAAGVAIPPGHSCSKDTDCVRMAACVAGHCECYIGYMEFKRSCISGPFYDQRCAQNQCRSPFVCNTHTGICSCPENATFNQQTKTCQASCSKTEVSAVGKCFPRVSIGEACTFSVQCSAAYSNCQNGFCECIQGTTKTGADNKQCLPKYNCPGGAEPLKNENNALIMCRKKDCTKQPLPKRMDTCPETAFCMFTEPTAGFGVCCPARNPICPVGLPDETKKCIHPRTEGERCPKETHFCYESRGARSCCPLPCVGLKEPVSYADGKCLAGVHLDDACSRDEQCPKGAHCVAAPDGAEESERVCECREDHMRTYNEARQVWTCRKVCAQGNVFVPSHDECFKVVGPLQACKSSLQCPKSLVCRDGKCQCTCGQDLYQNQCVSSPVCPKAAGDGVVFEYQEPLRIRPGVYRECVPSATPTGCLPRSFCYPASVASGGVCCSYPGPSCPNHEVLVFNEQQHTKHCSLSFPPPRNQACLDPNSHCYDYQGFISSYVSSNRRGVCCKRQPASEPVFPENPGFPGFPPAKAGGGELKPPLTDDADEFLAALGEAATVSGGSGREDSSGSENRPPNPAHSANAGLCPANQKPVRRSNGKYHLCNFHNPAGICGTGRDCILLPPVGRPEAQSGVCCTSDDSSSSMTGWNELQLAPDQPKLAVPVPVPASPVPDQSELFPLPKPAAPAATQTARTVCPATHTIMRRTNSLQYLLCNYYAYAEECGPGGSCYLLHSAKTTATARQLAHSGLCCSRRNDPQPAPVVQENLWNELPFAPTDEEPVSVPVKPVPAKSPKIGSGCPAHHSAKRRTDNGQWQLCNYLSYRGECGSNSYCFMLHAAITSSASLAKQAQSGVCCEPQPFGLWPKAKVD